MDLHTITQFALRLAGIYLLVMSLIALPLLFLVPSQYATTGLISLAVYALAAIGLLRFSGPIANRIVPLVSESGSVASAERILRVGMVLLGLYFIVTAASDLVFTWAKARFFYSALQPFPGSRGPDVTPDDFARLVASGVQIALGLTLAAGNRVLARLLGNRNDDR